MTRFIALLCGLAFAKASESWGGTERPINEELMAVVGNE